jgi:hypothetical protein
LSKEEGFKNPLVSIQGFQKTEVSKYKVLKNPNCLVYRVHFNFYTQKKQKSLIFLAFLPFFIKRETGF